MPRFLTPTGTLQMGIGNGLGVGVPPEHHPSSWFAAVVGRKRWVFHPNEGEPPGVLRSSSDEGASGIGQGADAKFGINEKGVACELVKPLRRGGLTCDQDVGEVIWTPSYWWHETCGLDDYSVGLGGVTYTGVHRATPETCDKATKDVYYTPGQENKDAPHAEYGYGSRPYGVKDIAYCQEDWSRCPVVTGLQIISGSRTRGDFNTSEFPHLHVGDNRD